MASAPTTTDLKLLIANDLAASNDLTTRITQLRNAIEAGQPPPRKTVDLMDRSNRDITHDLIHRIEHIESTTPTSQDRELLQALKARLAVCDGLAMRLAELRDLLTSSKKVLGEDINDPPSNDLSTSSPAMDAAATERHKATVSSTSKSHDRDPEGNEDNENDDASDSPFAPEPDPDPKIYPLLYRILSIPPSTPASSMPAAAKTYALPHPPAFFPHSLHNNLLTFSHRALAGLALKHTPRNFPNDPTAPARWAAITRAYDVLSDEGKRAFYDRIGGEGGAGEV